MLFQLGGEKSQKYFLENFSLDGTFWVTAKKKSLQTMAIKRASVIKFPL